MAVWVHAENIRLMQSKGVSNIKHSTRISLTKWGKGCQIIVYYSLQFFFLLLQLFWYQV